MSARSTQSSTSKRSAKSLVLMENAAESNDNRRVSMLKNQIMQLERQMLIMSNCIGQRKELLLKSSDLLDQLAQLCREAIGLSNSSPMVAVKRSDLTKIIENIHNIKSSLTVQVDNSLSDIQSYSKTPFDITSKFENQSDDCNSVQLKKCLYSYGLSSKRLSSLNLSEVSNLESKLAILHGCLVQLADCAPKVFKSGWMPFEFKNHFLPILKDALSSLDICSGDLLELSLLFPASYSLPFSDKLNSQQCKPTVNSSFPKLEFKKLMKSTKIDSNFRELVEIKINILNNEIGLLRDEISRHKCELEFHESVYLNQAAYIDSVIQGFRTGFRKLHANVCEEVVDPLEKVLTAYATVESYPSEEALKGFLDACRLNLPLLKSATDNLTASLSESEIKNDAVLEQLQQALSNEVSKRKS